MEAYSISLGEARALAVRCGRGLTVLIQFSCKVFSLFRAQPRFQLHSTSLSQRLNDQMYEV